MNRAIILLGVNTVSNLALSTAVLEKFSSPGTCPSLPMDVFWAHSICVGVTAKTIATVLDIPQQERESYFVAGLLHDLGKIPLSMSCPEEYGRITSSANLLKMPSVLLEESMFGVHHCAVGSMIAKKWRLGDALNDVLRHHHAPDEAAVENFRMTAIVALGDHYAREILEGPSRDGDLENQSAGRLLETVGISWSALADHRELILEEIEKAQIFLQISKRG